jgi:hypothetical protein
MRLAAVLAGHLAAQHAGEDHVADGHHDVQASADALVLQPLHDRVEQPLLARQPVHRRIRERLVHAIDVERYGWQVAQRLAQEVGQVVPLTPLQVCDQLVLGVVLVQDVGQVAVNGARCATVTDEVRVVLELVAYLPVHPLPQFTVAQQVRGHGTGDRAGPDPPPHLDQVAPLEELACPDDRLGGRQIAVRGVGVHAGLVLGGRL